MKKGILLAALSLMVASLTGCARPDRITAIKSPVDGLFYTVETFYGHGAPDSDFTSVYAHLERNGKADKQLVLNGTYLQISKLSWVGPHDVTLCMEGGITDSFRNQVTLRAGETSETVHNHLQEHCDVTPRTSNR